MIERYTLQKMGKIWEDENKFHKMLRVELLACEALTRLGKVPRKALEEIKKKAKFDVARTKEIEKKTKHDVIAFVANLSENIGRYSRYVHMGLTSSDVVDTAFASLMREATELLIEDLEKLRKTIAKQAKRYKYTPCVGRSHGVHAEPTTFGLKLALFYDETRRNMYRMVEAKDVISVGKISGAVGTYAHVDPSVEEYVCRKLKLFPAAISTQIVQRDRHAQFLSAVAIVGSSLEKFATEIRNLQRTEMREVEEPFGESQKGSSAMPHKRNPVTCERISGLARILRANALAAMENVTLWHERDISHSSVERVIVPDSAILLDYMINTMIEVINGLLVYPRNMRRNLEKTRGLIFSQRVLLLLIDKGLSRQKAYDLVQKNAMRAWKEDADFKRLLLSDKKLMKRVTPDEVEKCFNLDYYLRHVNRIFKKVGIK